MYIGPWQEFALSRALSQRPGRVRPRLRPLSEASDEPEVGGASDDGTGVSQLTRALREMASELDKGGAPQSLLALSPLFMSTIDGLLQPTAAGRSDQAERRPPVPPRGKGGGAKRVDPVRAKRRTHMERMRNMYTCGAGASDEGGSAEVGHTTGETGAHGAAQREASAVTSLPTVHQSTSSRLGGALDSTQTLPTALPSRHARVAMPTSADSSLSAELPPISPGKRTPSLPMRRESLGSFARAPTDSLSVVGELHDDWEDEVDDLLDWTKALPSTPGKGGLTPSASSGWDGGW